MKHKILTLLMVFGFNAHAGPSNWTLEQSPTTEVLNGISAANNYFAIGVGNNGSIVHFVNGDTGTLMSSGTTNDLYDVYAASDQLAVATGEDIVLLWDGTVWQTLLSSNTNTFFTGTWITPEQDFVFHQSLGAFNFICPHELGAANQGFCRGHNSPMLTMCGESDDIKVIMGSGDILHYNNQLGEFDGMPGPLYDQIIALNLTGVYVPENSCLPGPFKPLEIFAINNTNQFYHFDGDQWNNMGVSIPNDQTLTSLNGSGGNNMVATGFKPDGMSGNDGVIWTNDGTGWVEDTNLPAGTPGLTDVAVNIGLVDDIFANGFDVANRTFDIADLLAGKVAVGEELMLRGIGTLPPTISDLSVSKILLTPEPIHMGDTITFQLTIKNLGPSAQVGITMFDVSVDTILIDVDNCNMNELSANGNWHNRNKSIPNLAAGETQTCTMEFIVDGEVGEEIKNYAEVISEDSDPIFINNGSVVNGIIIQADN